MLKEIVKIIYWKIIYKIVKLFPVKEKAFFESFLGTNISDTPYAIYNHLINIDYEIEYIWSVNDTNIGPHNCNKVKKMSLMYLYHLATSKYIITNSRMPEGFTKKRNQKYIQSWHGTPLKKLVYDMDSIKLPNMSKEKYYSSFEKDVKQWDMLISPNMFATKCFRSAFRYNGKITEYGYPRNEELLDISKEDNLLFRQTLKINPNDKIILYAPTFRDNVVNKHNKYIQEINIDFNKIDMENTTILLRTHYLIEEVIYKYGKHEKCLNVSKINNINDLFKIADILITDYSSVFFDYLILERPIVFYQYDQEIYKDELRGFYFAVEDLPGEIVIEEQELYDCLEKQPIFKGEKFKLKYELNNPVYGVTEKVVEEIFFKENK